MFKKTILLSASILAAGLTYTAIAQVSQESFIATQEASVSTNLRLSTADQDLLLSILRNSSVRNEKEQIKALEENWTEAFIPPALEIFNFIPSSETRRVILSKLRETTGQDYGSSMNDWYRWLWNEPELKIAGYDNFKAEFYRGIDPKFERYFKDRSASARIRLDEIRWGGVRQDGIPPLRQPEMITAQQADYLDDDNVIFGIEVNGDVRAYPKRILAWHEMFVDNVGGIDFAGVYCTLCGTVILYETDSKGLSHTVGTSGFLYRSNKLMYDKATQSLWNTIKGEPVLGPLVDKDIALTHQSVVTTTWGKWKKLHPDTKVLSLNTGHRRDYGEGVAYHEYFATDNLMFNTPYSDQRLKNKEEILALRFKEFPFDQLAISADYLKKHPVYRGNIREQKFVIFTDETGANRVYDPEDVTFTQLKDSGDAIDLQGNLWRVEESTLTAPDGRTLKRLPYHRAFWFGWHATYPNSKLIK